MVRPDGDRAVSHYEVLSSGNGMSLIKLIPETGRTHQIRVHMTSLGHPLVGDKTYGSMPKGTIELLRLFPRQALHAAQLGFTHPITGKHLMLKTPLPQDRIFPSSP